MVKIPDLREIASGHSKEELENFDLQKEMYSLLIDELKEIKKGRRINYIALILNIIVGAGNIIIAIFQFAK